MVIEHVKNTDSQVRRPALHRGGRMPSASLTHHGSWVGVTGVQRFQVVEGNGENTFCLASSSR